MTSALRSLHGEDETTTMSLAKLSTSALQLFADLAIIASHDAETQGNSTDLSIEQQHERLALWASNLGATHLGHSSLDYRLREADLVRNAIGTFLKDLCESLLECRELLLYGDLSAMDDVRASNQSEEAYDNTDHNLDSIQQNMLETDYGSDTNGFEEQELSLILESIAETINCLYKIATRIRNPATRILTKKVLQFKMTDRETGVDLAEEYALLDREHLREVFRDYRSADVSNPLEEREISPQDLDSARRKPLEVLPHRLAQANTIRRKQFAYWSRHRKKLDAVPQTAAQAIRVQRAQSPRASHTPVPVARSIHEEHSVVPSQPTTATALDPAKIDLGDTKSVVTVSDFAGSIRSTSTTRREFVELPEPPAKLKGRRYFECPYCLTLCSGTYLERRAWRTHVLRDLRPYVCTYQDCSEATRLFDTRQDWVAHEDSCHRRIWRCLEHPEATFLTVGAYRHHIEANHVSNRTELQSTELLRVGESVSEVADRPCPICLTDITDASGLQHHIAAHLIRIALFALPRSTDADDDTESGTSWSGRAAGHHSDSSQDTSNKSSTSSTRPREDEMQTSKNEQRGKGTLSQNALRHLETVTSDQGSDAKLERFLSFLNDPDLGNQPSDRSLPITRKLYGLEDDGTSTAEREASSKPPVVAQPTNILDEDDNSQSDRHSATLEDLASDLERLKVQWEKVDEARRNSGSKEQHSRAEFERGSSSPLSFTRTTSGTPKDGSGDQDRRVRHEDSQKTPLRAPETLQEPFDFDGEVGYSCPSCGEVLEEGKAFELAGRRWHIDCYRCNTCGTLLDSDANVLLLGDGSLICNNCTYSCSVCGNKIEDLAILTGDRAFCEGCFRCRNCKRKIENLRYARTSLGIFCMSCHESITARRRKRGKHLPQLPSDINVDQPSDSVRKDLGRQDIDANNRKSTTESSQSGPYSPEPKAITQRPSISSPIAGTPNLLGQEDNFVPLPPQESVLPHSSSRSAGALDLFEQAANLVSREPSSPQHLSDPARPPPAATRDRPAKESKSPLFRGLFGSKKK